MKQRISLSIIAISAIAGAVALWAIRLGAGDVSAAPDVFTSPINGGCYIAGPNDCRIHVDGFTIDVDDASGEHLIMFQIQANGQTIYDFRPDTSIPPVGDYTPSQVMQDFAATCGQTYSLNLTCQDSGDPNPFNCGQTASFTCPAAVP